MTDPKNRVQTLIGIGDGILKFNVDFKYAPICRRCGVLLTPETLRHEMGLYTEGGYQAGFVTIFLCDKCEAGHGAKELTKTIKELKPSD